MHMSLEYTNYTIVCEILHSRKQSNDNKTDTPPVHTACDIELFGTLFGPWFHLSKPESYYTENPLSITTR